MHFASVGSLNEAMAHPRELFKSSILSNAASMMLIHCHPSGNVFPSKAVVIPFDNQISKDTDLYKLYNTNIHEIIEMKKHANEKC